MRLRASLRCGSRMQRMSAPDVRATQPHDAGCATSLRVFLITGEPLYREGLRSAFRATRSQILLEGTSISEAMALAKSGLADLVVIDVRNLRQAADMARALVACSPEMPIVALSAGATAEEVRALFEVGVRGYIRKAVAGGEFVRNLANIAQGTLYVPPEFGAGVLRQSMRLNGASPEKDKPCQLTAREQEILACVARALTNKEVARELKISEKTVKHYMTVIMQKLQVRNRVEAVQKVTALKCKVAS